MNCTNCRYELSQCLDGRLPSGRRAVVMEHAEQCPACGRFWNELQAAQQLTLRLSPTAVSSDFRDRLWDRIRAGEGTPDAVFHEPVSLATKVRYTLTGAAAAAFVLVGITLLRPRHTAAPRTEGFVASTTPPTNSAAPLGNRATDTSGTVHNAMPVSTGEPVLLANSPLVSATQPLTFNLVAVEAAKQLEQRRTAVTTALRRLSDPGSNHDAAVGQVFDNAEEFRAFGELLLDLRERRRLFFTDTAVDADLRFAVNTLNLSRDQGRSQRTIDMVAQALQSDHLADVAGTITFFPTSDPYEELEALVRLNRQRPEVFPKLFFVFGNDDELGQLSHGVAFLMPDSCGPAWVAPRSEVEARELRWRLLKRQLERVGGTVQVQVHSPAQR